MRKTKRMNKYLSFLCLMGVVICQAVIGVQPLQAAGSKMTNNIHKAYSNKLKELSSTLKSAIYAELDGDEIYEMIVGRLDSKQMTFYLEVYKYSNNQVKVIDKEELTGFGSNACGMNNYAIVYGKDGRSVALKKDFHHMRGGYGTWETTYYVLKNGKLVEQASEYHFSDAGARLDGLANEENTYKLGGKKVSKVNYDKVVKNYVSEKKIIDTGYSPKGGDRDGCKDYTNRGSAIHQSVKEDIKLVIGGNIVKQDQAAPIEKNGSVLVPIRVVSQYLGAQVEFKQPNITVTKGNLKIKLTLNSKTAYVNGTKITLDVAPVSVEGTTMVPLRFIAQQLSATTTWDKKTLTVTITEKAGAGTSASTQVPATSVATKNETPQMKLLGEGIIDTVPYRMGTIFSVITKELGEGSVQGFQGVRLHNYGNYELNESLYAPYDLKGGFFYEGFTLYGFTVGVDNAQTVRTQMGTPEVWTVDDDDEFASNDSTYCYSYSKNNNYLYVYFNAQNIIERVVMISKQ